jgi:hypothetical protein
LLEERFKYYEEGSTKPSSRPRVLGKFIFIGEKNSYVKGMATIISQLEKSDTRFGTYVSELAQKK